MAWGRRHRKAERLEFDAIHWMLRHDKLWEQLLALRARRKRITKAMGAVMGTDARLAALQDKLEALYAAYLRERVALSRRDARLAKLRERDRRAAVQEQALVEKIERFAVRIQKHEDYNAKP